MKVYHILNSCQVKVFLFFIFIWYGSRRAENYPSKTFPTSSQEAVRIVSQVFYARCSRLLRAVLGAVTPRPCFPMHVRYCVPITIPTASKQLRTNSLDGQFSARLLPYTVTIIYNKKQTVIMSGQLNFTVCSILISQTPNRHNPNS